MNLYQPQEYGSKRNWVTTDLFLPFLPIKVAFTPQTHVKKPQSEVFTAEKHKKICVCRSKTRENLEKETLNSPKPAKTSKTQPQKTSKKSKKKKLILK
jgi:hypothetical protein